MISPPDVWHIDTQQQIVIGHYHEVHYVSTQPIQDTSQAGAAADSISPLPPDSSEQEPYTPEGQGDPRAGRKRPYDSSTSYPDMPPPPAKLTPHRGGAPWRAQQPQEAPWHHSLPVKVPQLSDAAATKRWIEAMTFPDKVQATWAWRHDASMERARCAFDEMTNAERNNWAASGEANAKTVVRWLRQGRFRSFPAKTKGVCCTGQSMLQMANFSHLYTLTCGNSYRRHNSGTTICLQGCFTPSPLAATMNASTSLKSSFQGQFTY